MKRQKPLMVQVQEESGKRNFWTRSQIREILGISEATFKRRLVLLEEECPECDRVLHSRKFSDFQKWCLVQLEQIFVQCDRDLEKTRKHLENIGLNTDDYFKN
jgi:hypothetical protein